jgi:ribosomal protein S12 methylthiotransferase
MAGKKDNQIAVGFVALGCPKNIVDSERMLAQIAEAGMLITADPSQADVVVINTCGFIEPAKVESLEAIAQAVTDKRRGNVRKVVVAGCLSQRLGQGLLDEVEGIDAVMSLDERDSIVQIVRRTLAGQHPFVYERPPANAIADDRARLRIGPVHSAYLRISEGCNHRCSFCTIPAIRGPFRSKPQEMVLEEARELVASGAVELNLIGQDTTLYGRDLGAGAGLARLLGELEQVPQLAWIRLLYAYPTGITDDIIGAVAKSEKVVRYLDIPIQHASDKMLKAMRRPDTAEALRSLVERLRAAMPDVVLRTTLIVGFPGETEREFSELVEFVEWARFDALGAFTFFPEAGTPAAELPDQVSDEVKQARLERLMLAQQKIAFAKNEARIGSRLTCLVDEIDDEGNGYGRFYGQAPDIDSICVIEGCPGDVGRWVDVRVVGARDYDLVAERI